MEWWAFVGAMAGMRASNSKTWRVPLDMQLRIWAWGCGISPARIILAAFAAIICTQLHAAVPLLLLLALAAMLALFATHDPARAWIVPKHATPLGRGNTTLKQHTLAMVTAACTGAAIITLVISNLLHDAIGPIGAGAVAGQDTTLLLHTFLMRYTPILLLILMARQPPVSHPGGPRPARQCTKRAPLWPQEQATTSNALSIAAADAEAGGYWDFSCGAQSHKLTEELFHNNNTQKECKLTLTGEPTGRQMWTFIKTNNNNKKPEWARKQITQQGAYNASINPNAEDALFRTKQREGRTHQPGHADEAQSHRGESRAQTHTPNVAKRAARKGARFFTSLQCDDGHWAADYGGPHFLLPGFVITWYVTGRSPLFLDAPKRAAMTRYLRAHQQKDGGWGTHIESPSTMFGSVLCYTSLRLLGFCPADDLAARRGRKFIRQNGGAVYTSSWAKFWLCILGVMDWAGHNSIPAEMWLLPTWSPFHPGRMWCHCRMVYLPMCYLYCTRFVYAHADSDPLIQALREEIYDPDSVFGNYERVTRAQWDATRNTVASMDDYSPVSPVMRAAQWILSRYETARGPIAWLRNAVRARGVAYAREYMHAEDEMTNYICIGPVNKAMNMLSAFAGTYMDHVQTQQCSANNGGVARASSSSNVREVACATAASDKRFQRHMMRVPDYLWIAEDGMKVQGYNGSQCWDTSFFVQAVVEGGLAQDFIPSMRQAWSYLENTQVLCSDASRASPAFKYEDPEGRAKWFRHVSYGAWPFSTSAHGWPISDCTAEGVKGVLGLMRCTLPGFPTKLTHEDTSVASSRRMEAAVEVMLALQNADGGWATYENNRGYAWYESLNPSETFGDIMIDYSYVECSSACITALTAFRRAHPSHRTDEVSAAIRAGGMFLKSIQRTDGSWYGSWACCFTYGTWFGVEGLRAAGYSHTDGAIRHACTFLLRHQNENGGWGEDFTSCYNKAYAKRGMQSWGDEGSGIVPTAWAVLTLLAAIEGGERDLDTHVETCGAAAQRGALYLMKRQRENGDWPQEGIAGVFNRACGISYTNYRNIFPVWALGRFARFQEEGVMRK